MFVTRRPTWPTVSQHEARGAATSYWHTDQRSRAGFDEPAFLFAELWPPEVLKHGDRWRRRESAPIAEETGAVAGWFAGGRYQLTRSPGARSVDGFEPPRDLLDLGAGLCNGLAQPL